MKKSIFLFFAAILCAMTAKAYDQAAVDLYFDNSTSQWSECYVSVGHTSWTAFYAMERVAGTQYLWKCPANFNGGNKWGGAKGWVVSKDKWYDTKAEDITTKYVWHGDKNVTKLYESAWAATSIYKADGTTSVSKDGTTKTVYKVTKYDNNNYTVTINTVEGGTLTVKDYDNNAVASGASKIHLTVLKFSATPADGYVLDAVEINDGTNTTTIAAADLATKTHTLTSAVTITPVWRATTSTVTVTATATNGTVTGGGVVEEGTSVTLTATPDAGYKFANWTVGGVEVSTANPYTFTAEADVEVVANFEELPKATIYFVNNGGWSKVQAYAWDGTKGANPGWPGADITANKLAEKIGEYDVYSYTVEQGSYGKVIFNDGSEQTADYVWTDGNYYWYDSAIKNEDKFAGGTKEQAETALGALVNYDYYLTGSLVGGWDPKQKGIEKDGELYKATFTDLAAGTYEFKITKGDWEHQWNYSNLDKAYEEVSEGVDNESKPNGNIKIVTTAVKTITVNFDATANKISLEGLTPYVAPLTYTVTVPAGTEKCFIAGAMNGWNFQEMTATANANEFTIEIAGARESDGYKYACKADWDYVEKKEDGNDLDANRTWKASDVVAKWGVPPTYTIVGATAITGANWDLANEANKMIKDGETYTLTKTGLKLETGDYEYKVAKNGAWGDGQYPAEGNQKVTITETAEYTIVYTYTVGTSLTAVATKTGEYTPAQTVYTVAGDAALCGTNWQADDATNDMTANGDGTYTWTKADVKLTSNVGFKVVKNHDFGNGEYPAENWNINLVDYEGAAVYTVTITFTESSKDIAVTLTKTGETTPPVITYQLKGVGGWEQPGIELVQNPDPEKASEYMLTCQAISATDAIKVVRLEDGVIKDYYGNGTVKDGVEVTVNYDGDGNITLAEGTYNFYFDTNEAEKKLWIAAATDCVEYTDLTMTNLVVTPMEGFDLLAASESTYGISVTLGVDAEGNLIEGSNVTFNGETELPIQYEQSGKITKSTDEELGDVYSGIVVVTFGEDLMSLRLKMYSKSIEVTEINITGGTVALNAEGAYSITANLDGEDVNVSVPALEFEGEWVTILIGEQILSGTASATNVDGTVTLTAEGLEQWNDEWTEIIAIYNITITATVNIPEVTVYFINTPKWNAPIYAYAFTKSVWGRYETIIAENAPAPGLSATKTDYQIAGYDVYSYTTYEGLYSSVQFSAEENATEAAAWESNMYYIHNFEGNSDWYTREEAEALLTPKTPDYTRTVTSGNFGTICLPFGGEVVGAKLYELVKAEADGVLLGSVETLEAGVPYIFLATGTELAVYSDGTTAATPGDHNGLHGTFTNDTEVAAGNYILKDNELCQAEAICYVDANRAYVVWSEIPTTHTPMPGRRYIGMGVHGENGTTGLDNIMTTDAPVKTIENGQLIIIRNGEKYNVQGVRL